MNLPERPPSPPPRVVRKRSQSPRIHSESEAEQKYRKQKIPTAVREQVWIHHMGRVFEGKCPVAWCKNRITVFDFQSGHNVPESKGGETSVENLIPICARCNLSMSDNYTIDQWVSAFSPSRKPTPPFAPRMREQQASQSIQSSQSPPIKKRNWFRRFICFLQ
jgi:5-methylcytosine-specific restriction endonuclease McrA